MLDERYLIAKKGEGVSYVTDLHKLRFFEARHTLARLRREGMDAAFIKDSLMAGRGLVVATKPL